jgi:hypothetical protein
MRFVYTIISLLAALAATAGIAYLIGHSRALGHEEWRFEMRLVRAYSGEVLLHAGPLGLLMIGAIVALYYSARSSLVVLAATIIVGVAALYATREAVRAYIIAAPGALIRMPAASAIALLLLWLAALFVLLGILIAFARRRTRANRPTSSSS